jgi:uncharacterized protein YndB with AHSA1/START domain
MKPDLTEHNGRHRLRMHRRFDQPDDALWQALVDPELLSRWYPATAVVLEPFAGGKLRFDYSMPDDFSTEGDVEMHTTGQVTEFVERQVFAFVELAAEDMPREGDSLLRFDLRRDGSGSVLLFTQEFDDRPAAAAYAAGWDGCFDTLEQVAAEVVGTATRPPNTVMSIAARHEMYVHLFSLDKPLVSPTQVTVERQLMKQSPQKVWDLLVPAGSPSMQRLVPNGLGVGRVVEVGEGERVTVVLPDRSRIEWEISTGPGGARITVTHGPLHHVDVGALWRAHIESVVDEIYATP